MSEKPPTARVIICDNVECSRPRSRVLQHPTYIGPDVVTWLEPFCAVCGWAMRPTTDGDPIDWSATP